MQACLKVVVLQGGKRVHRNENDLQSIGSFLAQAFPFSIQTLLFKRIFLLDLYSSLTLFCCALNLGTNVVTFLN